MPTSPFTQQPARIPETVELPKTYEHALRLLNGSFHQKIADELWLVKAFRPRVDAIDLVYNGITLLSFDRASGWVILNTNGFPHYRSVLDIFRRTFAGSRISVTSSNTELAEAWGRFEGGTWRVHAHDMSDAGVVNTNPIESVNFVDMMAVHPGGGNINARPFELPPTT